MVLCVFNAFLSYQAAQVQCNNSTYQVGPHLMSRKQVNVHDICNITKTFSCMAFHVKKGRKPFFINTTSRHFSSDHLWHRKKAIIH